MAKAPKRLQSLADRFSEFTEEAIRCRSNRQHIWRKHDAHRESAFIEEERICENCGALRISKISNRGEILSRRIRYPEGYLSRDGRLENEDYNDMRLMVLNWDYGI